MKALLLCLLVTFGASQSTFAQRLARGQSLPDISFPETLNTISATLNSSEFRGRPLVIEFWSFNCSYCITSFMKMEAWKKKFGDKIDFLLVNLGTKQATLDFFKKQANSYSKIKMPKLPMVVNDKTLSSYFALTGGYPHIIWIDKNGVFGYRTQMITEAQVVDFMEGKRPEVVEVDPKEDFIPKTPLIEQPNKDFLNDITYYSYIAHALPATDIGHVTYAQNDAKTRIRLSNSEASVLELLIEAFSEDTRKYVFQFGVNVDLVVKDSSKYLRVDPVKGPASKYEGWRSHHSWRYDCEVPIERKNELFTYMQQDICRFFYLDVKVQRRKTKCLALVVIDSLKLAANHAIVEKGYIQQTKENRKDSIYWKQINMPKFSSALTQSLYFMNGVNLPIVDQTFYQGKISIALPFMDINSQLDMWRIWLKNCGLDLIEKELETEILVVKEKVI